MNSAPAHLESKLRLFLDLSVGQLVAVFLGILLGVVWAKWLAPFGGMAAALSGTYIAAVPVVPVFVASQSEFDLVDWRSARSAGGGSRAGTYRAPASDIRAISCSAKRTTRTRAARLSLTSRRSGSSQPPNPPRRGGDKRETDEQEERRQRS